MKIACTEDVRRWNAQVEIADLALSNWPGFDRMSPQRLHLQLMATGHTGLAVALQEAGIRLGYWAPDGGPATPAGTADPGAGLPADSRPTISADRTKSRCKDDSCDANHCPKCGGHKIGWYTPGLCSVCAETNHREFCANSARPGDVANVILERDKLRLEKEAAIFALKRSFYEANAIAEGRNKTFVCAPIVRDYCRSALAELGVNV